MPSEEGGGSAADGRWPGPVGLLARSTNGLLCLWTGGSGHGVGPSPLAAVAPGRCGASVRQSRACSHDIRCDLWGVCAGTHLRTTAVTRGSPCSFCWREG